jgi:hypothetical protein
MHELANLARMYELPELHVRSLEGNFTIAFGNFAVGALVLGLSLWWFEKRPVHASSFKKAGTFLSLSLVVFSILLFILHVSRIDDGSQFLVLGRFGNSSIHAPKSLRILCQSVVCFLFFGSHFNFRSQYPIFSSFCVVLVSRFKFLELYGSSLCRRQLVANGCLRAQAHCLTHIKRSLSAHNACGAYMYVWLCFVKLKTCSCSVLLVVSAFIYRPTKRQARCADKMTRKTERKTARQPDS